MGKLSPAEQAAYGVADALKAAVRVRTGLTAERLQCPREQSEMTPCVARDGSLAVALSPSRSAFPICVGCEADVIALLRREQQRAE